MKTISACFFFSRPATAAVLRQVKDLPRNLYKVDVDVKDLQSNGGIQTVSVRICQCRNGACVPKDHSASLGPLGWLALLLPLALLLLLCEFRTLGPAPNPESPPPTPPRCKLGLVCSALRRFADGLSVRDEEGEDGAGGRGGQRGDPAQVQHRGPRRRSGKDLQQRLFRAHVAFWLSFHPMCFQDSSLITVPPFGVEPGIKGTLKGNAGAWAGGQGSFGQGTLRTGVYKSDIQDLYGQYDSQYGAQQFSRDYVDAGMAVDTRLLARNASFLHTWQTNGRYLQQVKAPL